MAYGTTSAGKTYTMQGSVDNPGMIPRSLSYIFRALKGALAQRDDLQPFRGVLLADLTDQERQAELTFKNSILNLDLVNYQKHVETSYMPFKSLCEDTYESAIFKRIESNLEHSQDLDGPSGSFTIWVSMLEIYNDIVIDLLEFQKGERTCLSLGEDGHGGFYVKNAKQVHVRNGHEAYQVIDGQIKRRYLGNSVRHQFNIINKTLT